MKTILSILTVCLALICVAGGVALIGGFRSSRDLREANQKLQADLQTAQSKADALLAEKQEMTGQLVELQSLTQNLNARIASIETAKAKETDDAVPAATPYPVQAYLGQKFLGQAWVVPTNLRKDTNTQRYVCEPVVWLDESLRNSFTTHHTNVVEREIEKQTYYNSTTFYPQPVYYFSRPIYRRPGTSFSPPGLQLPAMPLPPASPTPYLGGSAVVARPTGTTVSQIKTRPQVLGTSARSIKPLQTPDSDRPLVP